jgi:transcriptional regulator with XRE-family HTH domain
MMVQGARRVVEPTQLRRIRDLMRWTQAQAADKAGVTENTWARWERGEMAVHPARVALLQHTLAQAEKRAARKAAKAAG